MATSNHVSGQIQLTFNQILALMTLTFAAAGALIFFVTNTVVNARVGALETVLANQHQNFMTQNSQQAGLATSAKPCVEEFDVTPSLTGADSPKITASAKSSTAANGIDGQTLAQNTTTQSQTYYNYLNDYSFTDNSTLNDRSTYRDNSTTSTNVRNTWAWNSNNDHSVNIDNSDHSTGKNIDNSTNIDNSDHSTGKNIDNSTNIDNSDHSDNSIDIGDVTINP